MADIGNAYRALLLNQWGPFFFELIMKRISKRIRNMRNSKADFTSKTNCREHSYF
jgi:hypothetical protein